MGNIINTCIRFKSKFYMGDAHFVEIDLLCIFSLFLTRKQNYCYHTILFLELWMLHVFDFAE